VALADIIEPVAGDCPQVRNTAARFEGSHNFVAGYAYVRTSWVPPLNQRDFALGHERALETRYGYYMKNENVTFDPNPRLLGELIEVRPLRADDWEGLFAAASDPLIWEQHPARDRFQEDVFREFFREALETASAFVVIDRKTGKIIGSSRYFGFDPQESVVEIGWTFLARAFWGGEYNRELKRLMLDNAFRFVDRVVFVIGVTNFRSQKAIEKIGGVRCGRRDKVVPRGIVESFVYEIRRQSGDS